MQWRRRDQLVQSLEERMVYVDILRALLQRPAADAFDLLAHVAFGADIHSCEERAAALFNLHRQFLDQFSPEAREVLLTLVEKYRYGGVTEVTDPRIFALAPFNSDVRQVATRFGGIPALRAAIDELVRRLYVAEAA
jgi:type I restriction enzyme R subunit